MTTKQIRIRHARERAALRARQDLEMAIHICSGPGRTALEQAKRHRISLSEVIRLRRVWRNHNPVKTQAWEPSI